MQEGVSASDSTDPAPNLCVVIWSSVETLCSSKQSELKSSAQEIVFFKAQVSSPCLWNNLLRNTVTLPLNAQQHKGWEKGKGHLSVVKHFTCKMS